MGKYRLMPKKIRKLGDYFPIYLVFVYAIGYIYYLGYFFSFGVNVSNYFSLIDIFFHAINLIFVFLFLNVIFFLFYYIYFVVGNIIINKRSNNGVLDFNEGSNSLNFKNLDRRSGRFACYGLLILIVVNVFFQFFDHLVSPGKFIIIIPFLIYGFASSSNVQSYYKGKKLNDLMIYFISALICCWLAGLMDAKILKKNGNIVEYVIYSDNVVAKTSSTLLFVSESTESVILYDTELKKAVILNKEKISKIESTAIH